MVHGNKDSEDTTEHIDFKLAKQGALEWWRDAIIYGWPMADYDYVP